MKRTIVGYAVHYDDGAALDGTYTFDPDVPGITKDDAACLHAVGITTLTGLETKLDALRAERGRQNATLYDVLRQYGGAFTPGDAERIGDAIMDHLNVGKAVGAAVDAKGKRKGVK